MVSFHSLSKCPITGFPVKKFSQWENVILTDSYSVSFFLIGDNIILSIPKGNAGVEGIKKFLEKRNEFLCFSKLNEKKYIELKDYSKISGTISRESRMIFAEAMNKEKDRGYLLALLGKFHTQG